MGAQAGEGSGCVLTEFGTEFPAGSGEPRCYNLENLTEPRVLASGFSLPTLPRCCQAGVEAQIRGPCTLAGRLESLFMSLHGLAANRTSPAALISVRVTT